MTHHAYQDKGKLELDADWIVVGSGAGGATAALQLARHGHRVILVEAGAWRDPEHYPTNMYGAMRDWFFDWGSTVAVGKSLWPVVQGQAVGGTTVINSAICVRTPEDVFDLWEREHGLNKSELSKTLWRHQDDLERELIPEVVPEAARGYNKLAMLGSERSGFDAHYMTRYTQGCEGAGFCLQGCRKRRKQSLNLNFVPELLERGGTVVSCAPVSQVDFDWRHARGVSGRFVHPATKKKGARFSLRARNGVFVAASCTHTAPLLERSGVRHAALGKFFRSHPGTGVIGVYDDPVDMHVGATQGWSSMAFRDSHHFKLETLALPLDLLASRLSGGGHELMGKVSKYRHLSMTAVALRADASGTVSSTPDGKPLVKYSLEPQDLLRMRQGVGILARAHLAAGAKGIMPGFFGLPDILTPDQVPLLDEMPLDPRRYIAILSHLFGGAVMGTDPARSVCDPQGRVRGYTGLWVADASVIPTTLGVNPQHTIMALARAIADNAVEATKRA